MRLKEFKRKKRGNKKEEKLLGREDLIEAYTEEKVELKKNPKHRIERSKSM